MYTKAVIPYKPRSSTNLLIYMNQKVIYVHSRSSTMHTKAVLTTQKGRNTHR